MLQVISYSAVVQSDIKVGTRKRNFIYILPEHKTWYLLCGCAICAKIGWICVIVIRVCETSTHSTERVRDLFWLFASWQWIAGDLMWVVCPDKYVGVPYGIFVNMFACFKRNYFEIGGNNMVYTKHFFKVSVEMIGIWNRYKKIYGVCCIKKLLLLWKTECLYFINI